VVNDNEIERERERERERDRELESSRRELNGGLIEQRFLNGIEHSDRLMLSNRLSVVS
jgi:hypothetical protein